MVEIWLTTDFEKSVVTKVEKGIKEMSTSVTATAYYIPLPFADWKA